MLHDQVDQLTAQKQVAERAMGEESAVHHKMLPRSLRKKEETWKGAVEEERKRKDGIIARLEKELKLLSGSLKSVVKKGEEEEREKGKVRINLENVVSELEMVKGRLSMVEKEKEAAGKSDAMLCGSTAGQGEAVKRAEKGE
jgi:hypothetical protein